MDGPVGVRETSGVESVAAGMGLASICLFCCPRFHPASTHPYEAGVGFPCGVTGQVCPQGQEKFLFLGIPSVLPVHRGSGFGLSCLIPHLGSDLELIAGSSHGPPSGK